MATLRSEEKDCPSQLEFRPGDKQIVEQSVQEECWQRLTLVLSSGDHSMSSTPGDNCSVCRMPTDEIENFAQQLESLLKGQKQKVNFEPNEPSFELSLERSRRAGIKVEAWIDAGNAKTGFYTWDAAGVRFFTTDENLADFINQIRQEFYS